MEEDTDLLQFQPRCHESNTLEIAFMGYAVHACEPKLQYLIEHVKTGSKNYAQEVLFSKSL